MFLSALKCWLLTDWRNQDIFLTLKARVGPRAGQASDLLLRTSILKHLSAVSPISPATGKHVDAKYGWRSVNPTKVSP
jgi:hypothetical protein